MPPDPSDSSCNLSPSLGVQPLAHHPHSPELNPYTKPTLSPAVRRWRASLPPQSRTRKNRDRGPATSTWLQHAGCSPLVAQPTPACRTCSDHLSAPWGWTQEVAREAQSRARSAPLLPHRLYLKLNNHLQNPRALRWTETVDGGREEGVHRPAWAPRPSEPQILNSRLHVEALVH